MLLRLIDEEYTRHPFYGTRRLSDWLGTQGHDVGRDRARTLMRRLGVEAIYPKRCLSLGNTTHKKYPYLLSGLLIDGPNHVWCSDITYIRLRGGFVYLVAVMDWHSRCVLSWDLSITLDTEFCLAALERALLPARPRIFNTDQGSQFTSESFTSRLKEAEVRISMDGKGRFRDNIFVERLWRTLKYERIYLNVYETGAELSKDMTYWFNWYNVTRKHSSLDKLTPDEAYYQGLEKLKLAA